MELKINLEVYVVVQIDGDGNPYLQGVFQDRARADKQFDRIVEEDQLTEWPSHRGIYETTVRCAGDEHGSVHMMKRTVI